MSAAALKPVVAGIARGKPFNMGMVFPSPHNYELRYWLAAGGLHPGFYAPPARRQLGPAPGGRAAVGDAAPDARHPGGGDHRRLQRGEPWNQQAVARA